MTQETFDVVVCGFGGSGAAAAIEAHDAGASVLVLEKMDAGGGSTAESGGTMVTIADADRAIEHYLLLTEGRTPREVIEAHVHGVGELPGWLRSCGAEPVEYPVGDVAFPHRYHGSAYPTYEFADGIGPRVRLQEPGNDHGGSSLWRLLSANVERRQIDIRYRCRARDLLRSDDGTVTGVIVDSEARVFEIGARRGVILTCGGFAYGRHLHAEAFGAELYSCSPPGRNTGDGIEMAIRAGAALWHMNAVAGAFAYKVPNSDAAWLSVLLTHGFFIVDQNGRRYMNESAVEQHAAGFAMLTRRLTDGRFDRLPSYLIFDEATRLAGPIASREGGANRLLHWSADNAEEIAMGWIVSGATVEEIAARLDMGDLAAAQLVDTASSYERASSGDVDEFGRPSDKMPALVPPYYAIPLYPALLNTQGGPRRDHLARVVDVEGRPIRGLYSAGELGSIWSSLYPGAGNVSEALVFGRIAGRSAAAHLIAQDVNGSSMPCN